MPRKKKLPLVIKQVPDGEYLTPTEFAAALDRPAGRSSVYRWIHEGKVKTVKKFSGKGKTLIPKDELRRINNPDSEPVAYLVYDGLSFPHLSFLMYLLLETRNNDFAKVLDYHQRYRLMVPLYPECGKLWEAMLATAPKKIAQWLRNPKRHPEKLRSWKPWLRALGVLQLYEEPFWPCMEILRDHSDRRIKLECLLAAKVPHKEICQVLLKQCGIQWSEEQILFFATYFFNTYNHTEKQYFKYVGRIGNQQEKYYKANTYNNPDKARAEFGIPTRLNMKENLALIGNYSMLNTSRLLLSPSLEDLAAGHQQAKLVMEAGKQLENLEQKERELLDEAHRKAAKEAPEISFEKKSDEPVDYAQLGQSPLDDKSEEGEQEAKVG